MIALPAAVGTVERDGVASAVRLVHESRDALVLVPKALDGIVALGGRGGVEVVRRAGGPGAVQRHGLLYLAREDARRDALGRVAEVGDGIVVLVVVGGVKVITGGAAVCAPELGDELGLCLLMPWSVYDVLITHNFASHWGDGGYSLHTAVAGAAEAAAQSVARTVKKRILALIVFSI